MEMHTLLGPQAHQNECIPILKYAKASESKIIKPSVISLNCVSELFARSPQT